MDYLIGLLRLPDGVEQTKPEDQVSGCKSRDDVENKETPGLRCIGRKTASSSFDVPQNHEREAGDNPRAQEANTKDDQFTT